MVRVSVMFLLIRVVILELVRFVRNFFMFKCRVVASAIGVSLLSWVWCSKRVLCMF